jgi:hypothetical protein
MLQAALILFVFLWSCVAHAEKRVALVIGNSAYRNVQKLPNPKKDAEAIADLFRGAGFDVVDGTTDLAADALRRALRDFSQQVRDADIAVVFYAGHGMEMNGVNYLIPVDATLARDIDVEDEAVTLDRVIRTIEPARQLQLVILDSCRDNPFLGSMQRTIVSRSLHSGLGDIDERNLPPNTLIAYAQQAGLTAEDGAGVNSPYTMALLKHLFTPGLDVELALRRVRDEVLTATHNRQRPFKYGSLGGTEIVLMPTDAPPQVAPAAPPRPVIDYDKEMEITFWNVVKDTKSKDLLQTYLDRYPAGNFSGLTKVLIEQIDKEQNATRLAAERDTEARAAEAARTAAETKQADELRKADELRRAEEKKRTEAAQRAEAEARAEAQRANDAIRKAEVDRLAAQKEAEEARREADAARAEQQRLAKLAAEVTAAQKPTTVVAPLPPGEQAPAAAKQADDPIAELARALQTELKRLGCDPGNVDGVWGDRAKAALAKFARIARVTVPSDTPSSEALQKLLGQKSRICAPREIKEDDVNRRQASPKSTDPSGRDCFSKCFAERTKGEPFTKCSERCGR